jgi:hypothetical protein
MLDGSPARVIRGLCACCCGQLRIRDGRGEHGRGGVAIERCGRLRMPAAAEGSKLRGVDPDDEARRRDAEDRERFAIRRLEDRMTEVERTLERRLDDLEQDVEDAEATVDRDLRMQEFGRDPEHPPFWDDTRPEATEPVGDDRDAGEEGR